MRIWRTDRGWAWQCDNFFCDCYDTQRQKLHYEETTVSKANEFPEFLYVRIEEDGGEKYMIAGDSPAEIASDVGSTYRTGRYKLVATGVTLNQPHYVEDESASKK